MTLHLTPCDAPRLLPCAIAIMVEAHAHAVAMAFDYINDIRLSSGALSSARRHQVRAADIVRCLRAHGADAAADDLSIPMQAINVALSRAPRPTR